ncbi:PA1B2 acetylhydrolase, partial [Polyodon spathula]|nr:PA1B2 acetylhydrolase [Polyodon spathula]
MTKGDIIDQEKKELRGRHHRFVSDSKDKEPEVLFVGDCLVQLLHHVGAWRWIESSGDACSVSVNTRACCCWSELCVLGLLPRGRSPNALRVKNARVNQLIQEALPSLPGASFLDVDPGFVLSDGTISHHDMYDYLHLTRAGYATVCQPIHTRLLAMLEQQKI